ncbi:MAG: hypothetical protein N3A60_07940, partial [Thermanaerothrix sp.]|nr:hypothetical protein [Thermanaerothrix sp.]
VPDVMRVATPVDVPIGNHAAAAGYQTTRPLDQIGLTPHQTEVLAKTHLEPPQITQLAQRCQHLGFDPGTLTVAQMLAQFQRLSGV